LASDAFWRFVPIAIVVAISSYVLGTQVVRPEHRMIKAGALLLVLAILTRFDMLYSLYFFILLFPFPSGVVLTSTNVILMTVIPLVWVARSRASGQKLFARTDIDKWIMVFLLAHIVSLFNVETTEGFTIGIKLIWRLLSAVAFFYLIVTFVDDEKKLERITKVIALAGGLVALTGIVELFAPGASLIPGWIDTRQPRGEGLLGYRIVGLRLGGSLHSWDLLSDYCAFTLFFMVTHFLRGKNPIEKLFWLGVSIMTFAVLLATANRGAIVSLACAFVYSLWVFRAHLNLVRYVVLISAAVVAFGSTQLVLDKYTLAASVTDRIMGTRFQGVVPESRGSIWEAALKRSYDHILIGHGPWYDTGKGLAKVSWPHNGYLYYLFTIGLFGLSVFLVIAYRILRVSLRYSHPLAAGSFLGIAFSIFNVQLVMFLVGQMRADHQRTGDFIYPYIVWMLFGLICAAGHMLEKREIEAGERSREPSESVRPSMQSNDLRLDKTAF
jgi:O-antigen ligase